MKLTMLWKMIARMETKDMVEWRDNRRGLWKEQIYYPRRKEVSDDAVCDFTQKYSDMLFAMKFRSAFEAHSDYL